MYHHHHHIYLSHVRNRTKLQERIHDKQGSADTVCPRPPLTLIFDRLTLKLVRESHLTQGTFLPNLGTLGHWVLELLAV